MKGKIIKGIAGFYYVHCPDTERAYECKAKGIFRKNNIKPLVGDDVEFEILDSEELVGNITDILPRRNSLIRPAVANVDQSMIIFAVRKPEPNLNLLDRLLIMMAANAIPVIICFNKQDIASPEDIELLTGAYEACGNKVCFASAVNGDGIDMIKELLTGKTTTVAGPSGVGKSTIVNCLTDRNSMETGEISEKINRGRHTTRHSEILALGKETYILDTPGFSSLGIFECTKENLRDFYPEFADYQGECKFHNCIHVKEPDCGVRRAACQGKISSIRYNNYLRLLEEMKNARN